MPLKGEKKDGQQEEQAKTGDQHPQSDLVTSYAPTPQAVDKAPVATAGSASVPGGAQWTKKHGVVHSLLKEPAGAHWKAHRGNVIKEAHTG